MKQVCYPFNNTNHDGQYANVAHQRIKIFGVDSRYQVSRINTVCYVILVFKKDILLRSSVSLYPVTTRGNVCIIRKKNKKSQTMSHKYGILQSR